MDQNQLMEEAVKHIDTAFRHLTLASDKIDKAQTNGTADDVPVLRKLRVKQNAIRAIGSPYLIPLTADQRNYEALRETLKINDERNDFQLLTAEEYKSPRDLVSVLVYNGDATRATVKKLFEKQYEFEWHTETGDPDPFSFYGFCDDVFQENDEDLDVMTYNTRKAHVISRLYHVQKELLKIRHVPYQELCPPVYVLSSDATLWETWKFDFHENKLKIIYSNDVEKNIGWITNDKLREYITSKSLKNRSGNLPNEVGHLYWAVLEEDDYDKDRKRSETLPFRTQVYVGQAKNGIKERWTGDGTSHCKKMEFARDVMCDMLSYDPTALRFEQLVDLRLLLHKACNQNYENSGLFIMDQFINQTDDQNKKLLNAAETNNINGYASSDRKTPIIDNFWRPKDMNYGMNYDYVRE